MISILYISELNLPSTSAYAQHVLKICDAFARHNKIDLLVFSNKSNIKQLKKDYILKNNFKIIKFSSSKLNNFISRIRLAFYVKNISSSYDLIYTRSPIVSLILSFFNVRSTLEIHHELFGLTFILFKIFNFFKLDKYIKYIFLHKNLKKIFKNKKHLVLDDCVDINDYKKKEFNKNYKFVYTGSLYEGKGIEIITYLAKSFPNEKFYIFGNKKTLSHDYKLILEKQKNIILKGYYKYKFLPSILLKSEFLLMPYLDKIKVNSKNLDVSKYMSPLKLFDYLAAGKVIIASKLDVYGHVLKNRKNCFLISPYKMNKWTEFVGSLLRSRSKYSLLKKNAQLTAKKFTWENRVKKIIKFNNL